jgi:serralysin
MNVQHERRSMRESNRLVAIVVGFVCAAAPAHAAQNIVTGTDSGTTAHVKRFETPSLLETASFFPFAAFTGGARVAFNDVTGDAVDDIVVGTGPGISAQVRVFDGVTLAVVRDFQPYGPGFSGGVFVASADFNADGKADIITGTDSGPPTTVTVFDSVSLNILHNFLPFGGFTGGARVAAGLVNAGGTPDIVVGAGPGAAPQVTVFDGVNLATIHSFLAYAPGFTGGVYVAAGDINGDGSADIVTGPGPGGAPQVKAFHGVTLAEIANFLAFAPGFTGGVRVAAGRVNADLVPDFVAGTGNGAAEVKAFDGTTQAVLHDFLPYGAGFTGGVFVAAPFTQGVVPVGLRDFAVE